MDRIFFKLTIFLIFFQIRCESDLRLFYKFYKLDENKTLVNSDPDGFNRFVKNIINSTSVTLQYVRAEQQTISYPTSVNAIIKTVSRAYDCAIIYDPSYSYPSLNVVKFAGDNYTIIENLLTNILVSATNVDQKTFYIGDMCHGLRIDDQVYHYKNYQYNTDTLPTWTNFQLDSNFTYAAADEGLFKYSTDTYSYELILQTSFLVNKKIWTNSQAILVLSWADTSVTNIKNYSLQAFTIPQIGSNYSLVTKVQGQYWGTVSNYPPRISLSQSLRTIIMYYKVNSTSFSAKSRIINYKNKSSTQFPIPQWITTTQSVIQVSDYFLYARNIVDIIGYPAWYRQYGYYSIFQSKLYQYGMSYGYDFPDGQAYSGYNSFYNQYKWVKSKIVDQNIYMGLNMITQKTSPPPYFRFYKEKINPGYRNDQNFFQLDFKRGYKNATFNGPGTSFHQHPQKLVWFVQGFYKSSYKTFISFDLQNRGIKIEKNMDKMYVLKALSQQYKCALIHDTQDNVLLFVDSQWIFGKNLQPIIDLSVKTIQYSVSESCNTFRINNRIFYYNSYVPSEYEQITFQDGLQTLKNPVFISDFSLILTDSGVYSLIEETTNTSKSYQLLVNQTFYGSKKIWKYDNKFIIFIKNQQNSQNYSWKVYLYYINDSTAIKMNDFSGTFSNQPKIYVGTKLTKILIQGLFIQENSQSNVIFKTINWNKNNITDINIPPSYNNNYTQYALTDQYLYAKNLRNDKKHAAWVIIGTTLFQAFNEVYPYAINQNFQRTLIKFPYYGQFIFILVHQYSYDYYYRFITQQKKSLTYYINPNPIETYLTSLPKVKKQIQYYLLNLGIRTEFILYNAKFQYTKYDFNSFKTKKTLNYIFSNNQMNNSWSIIANSLDLTCFAFDRSGELTLLSVDQSYSSIIALEVWPKIDPNRTYDYGEMNAYYGENISLGSNCKILKLGKLVFIKNQSQPQQQSSSAYQKQETISNLNNPVFDSSLKIAYSQGKVYKFQNNNYQEIFTVNGLQTNVEINSSLGLNRILFLSYSDYNQGTRIIVIKLYYKNQNTWQQFPLQTQISQITNCYRKPQLILQPSLQTIGFFDCQSYIQNTYKFYITKVYYGSKQSIKYELYVNHIQQQILLFKNYVIHYERFYYQYFMSLYRIDKNYNKLILIYRKYINRQRLIQFLGYVKIVQEDQNPYLLQMTSNQVNYLRDGWGLSQPTFFIGKSFIGNQTEISIFKGIDFSQDGFMVKNGKLYVCLPGCSHCLDQNTCAMCMSGYSLDFNQRCIKCSINCQGCIGSQPQQCKGCLNGYFGQIVNQDTEQFVCLKCPQNCFYCSEYNSCQVCKIGFYRNQNYSCTPMIQNCILLIRDSSTTHLCNRCRIGFSYNKDTKSCVQCSSSCTSCNPNNIYECTSCDDGYQSQYLNDIMICKKCPSNCKDCLNGTCINCRQGFRLKNNICITQCQLPCKQCSVTNNTQCFSCVQRYVLMGNQCIPDLACNTDKNCPSCPIGYNLIKGYCYQCQGGPNCRTCRAQDFYKCASCHKGFYLESDLSCQPCNLTGCELCQTKETCEKCKRGYVSDYNFGNGLCIKCHESCKQCFFTPYDCQICAQGYVMRGWKCVGSNAIRLDLDLDGQLSQFTPSNYSSVQQILSQKLSIQPNQIRIENLTSGSIKITATIYPKDTSEQDRLSNAISSTLTAGSTIGGYHILRSGSTVVTLQDIQQTPVDNQDNNQQNNDMNSNDNNGNNNDGNPNDNNGNNADSNNSDTTTTTSESSSESSTNLKIILGIVIPVFTIIIIVVTVALLKKNRKLCFKKAQKAQKAFQANEAPTLDQINANNNDNGITIKKPN